ncbi:MAG: hypothetical protein JXR96_05310 [Deltaproteobacteria bacterium]|nr:hypothetical protein [Deltaproteobacteria bacterium]
MRITAICLVAFPSGYAHLACSGNGGSELPDAGQDAIKTDGADAGGDEGPPDAGGDPGGPDGADGADAADGADGAADGGDEPALPPDPTPLSITFSGAIDETIEFTLPSCIIYPRPADVNFRHFWRHPDHNAVLIVEVLTVFEGVGEYDQSMGRVLVKLQSEAGSPYDFFFQTDTGLGDSVSVSVEHADPEGALWGSFTFSGLHGDGNAVTASPLPVPLWCPEVGQ